MKKLIKLINKPLLGIFIGILFSLLLLEFFLRLFGWWQVSKFEFYKPVLKNNNEIVILALGDSMTALGGRDSYPLQLEKILNDSKKFSKYVRVVNAGVVGSSSRNLLVNLDENISKFKPDIVTTMMGGNDYKAVYEVSSGINSNNLLVNLKSYRLIKFIVKNIIDIFKNNSREWVYLKYGDYYASKGNRSEAKKNYEKGIELYPESDSLYMRIIPYLNSFDEKENYCTKAIKLNPKNEMNKQCLIDLYSVYEHDVDKEFALLNEAIKKFPDSPGILYEMGKLSFMKGDYDEAEKKLVSASKFKNFEKPIKIYDLLEKIYVSQGRVEDANKVRNYILTLSKETSINYPVLASTLNKYNIPLVAIQYPRRDVGVLKSYLAGFSNAYFVDNNQSFEEAVNQYGFDKIFIDAFAGDFGHGSTLGNKIIAQNVAKIILDQVLNNGNYN